MNKGVRTMQITSIPAGAIVNTMKQFKVLEDKYNTDEQRLMDFRLLDVMYNNPDSFITRQQENILAHDHAKIKKFLAQDINEVPLFHEDLAVTKKLDVRG